MKTTPFLSIILLCEVAFLSVATPPGDFAERVAPLRRLSGAVPIARKSLEGLWQLRSAAPAEHRETFKEAVAAGWLSIEDRANYEKVRAELKDPVALEKETSSECSACLGTGESAGKKCFRCKGSGRLPDWKLARKVYEGKLDSIPGLAPEKAAGSVLGAAAAERLRHETNAVSAAGAAISDGDAKKLAALFKDVPLRLLKADCVRDAGGKPSVFVGEGSRQASVSVRLAIDGDQYRKFARDAAAHMPSMSRRTATASVPGFKGASIRDFPMEGGGFRFYFLFPSMKGSDYDGWMKGNTVFVVSNPLTMTGVWYYLDDAHFAEIERLLCRPSESQPGESDPARAIAIDCELVGEDGGTVFSTSYEYPRESWVLTARMPAVVAKSGRHLAITPFLSVDAFVPGWGMLGSQKASGLQFVGASPERDYRFASGTGFMKMDGFDVLMDLPLEGVTPEQLLATADVKISLRFEEESLDVLQASPDTANP